MGIAEFYRGKRVLVTGHTGFKGSWLCQILLEAGAQVTGYSLEPPTRPSLFEMLGLEGRMRSVTGDVRDLEHMERTFRECRPQIVFHLAAQPIVLASYQDPVGTYSTNVMGTVHVLECVRRTQGVESFVNVTTDKVYDNREWVWGYRETDPLDGFDPYSNSKSCSELVTHSYIRSFFSKEGPAVSTVRAGNVIGGGDFARDRIIPDCIRAALGQKPVFVRNPFSVRPFQHVLDPLSVYLMIGAKQAQNPALAGCYNVGPEEPDCSSAGKLAELFCRFWGEGQTWNGPEMAEGEKRPDLSPHEAGFLKLDCSKLASVFGWQPVWDIRTAVEKTVEWTKGIRDGQDAVSCTGRQIKAFLEDAEKGGNNHA